MFEKANKDLDKQIERFFNKNSYLICDLERYGAKFRKNSDKPSFIKKGTIYVHAIALFTNHDEEFPVIISYRPFEGHKLMAVDIKSTEEQMPVLQFYRNIVINFIADTWSTPELSFRFLAPKLRKILWALVLVCLLIMTSSLLAIIFSLLGNIIFEQTLFVAEKITDIFSHTSYVMFCFLLVIYMLHQW